MAKLLTEDEITIRLSKLKDWRREAGTIFKDYILKDFVSALGFVNRVGELAEGMDHHPDILIHGYKRVRLTLTTHQAVDAEGLRAQGLTRMDFDLADRIETSCKDSVNLTPPG